MMREQSGSPAAPEAQPKEEMGLLGRIGKSFGDMDQSDILMALGSGMLGLSQDKGLQQLGMAGFGQVAERGETRKATAQANKTVDALRKMKRNDLADAVSSGALKATDAYKIALDGGDMKVVGKSAIRMNPDGTVSVLYTDESGGDEATAAFRTLQARAQAAGLKQGTPEYNQFMIDGGSKSGFAIRTTPDGGFEFVQGSASMKPLTESQAKATGFYGRMKLLSPTIDSLESQGTQFFDSIVKGIPIAGNYLTSPEYKQYMYAKDNWIAAQLRDESGAAIGSDEYMNADKQYFPQLGDTPEVIEQKRKLRRQAEEAMRTKAGTGVSGDAKVSDPLGIRG